MDRKENKKMKAIIFDTETAGMSTQTLLNIGYKIVDINIQQGSATTIEARDYLVTEVINNKLFMLNDAFVGAEKYEKLLNAYENGGAVKRPIQAIFKTIASDIEKHGVLFGYAFNCAFDTDKFTKTATEYGIENPLEKIPVFDIWGYANNYITNNRDYYDFCIAHNLLTKTERFIQTNVESITKFLTGNLEFAEDHTALSDVGVETEILLECIRRGADITRGMSRGGNIESGKVFTDTIFCGEHCVKIHYTQKTEKDGVITYKNGVWEE